MYWHDGWRPGDGFLGVFMPPRTLADHEVNFFGDLQLYRRGEWALTHPLGYGSVAPEGEAVNSMLIAGLSSMTGANTAAGDTAPESFRGPIAQEFGDSPAFAYLAGTTWGNYYGPTYYQRPPEFCHEWTRSVFYLPSPDRRSDTIVVFDRTLASNPNRLPSFEGSPAEGVQGYRATGGNGGISDRQRIVGNPLPATPALKQWIFHCPTEPAVDAGGLSWKTAGGQRVRVRTFLPVDGVKTVYDEAALWSPPLCPVEQKGAGLPDRERKWQFRVSPRQPWPSDNRPAWDVFLNVIHVQEADGGADSSPVRSADGEAAGVVVHRPGLDDVVVIFSATPSTRAAGKTDFRRVRRAGYSVSWESVAETTVVYLFDLDPSRKWSCSRPGGRKVTIPVSDQGKGQLLVRAGGRHVLELSAE